MEEQELVQAQEGQTRACQAGAGTGKVCSEKHLFCLWGCSIVGSAGMKLEVLGYWWGETDRRGGRGQVMHDSGC